jgi:hypothetical protein
MNAALFKITQSKKNYINERLNLTNENSIFVFAPTLKSVYLARLVKSGFKM